MCAFVQFFFDMLSHSVLYKYIVFRSHYFVRESACMRFFTKSLLFLLFDLIFFFLTFFKFILKCVWNEMKWINVRVWLCVRLRTMIKRIIYIYFLLFLSFGMTVCIWILLVSYVCLCITCITRISKQPPNRSATKLDFRGKKRKIDTFPANAPKKVSAYINFECCLCTWTCKTSKCILACRHQFWLNDVLRCMFYDLFHSKSSFFPFVCAISDCIWRAFIRMRFW